MHVGLREGEGKGDGAVGVCAALQGPTARSGRAPFVHDARSDDRASCGTHSEREDRDT